jgi:hypothetical protein
MEVSWIFLPHCCVSYSRGLVDQECLARPCFKNPTGHIEINDCIVSFKGERECFVRRFIDYSAASSSGGVECNFLCLRLVTE